MSWGRHPPGDPAPHSTAASTEVVELTEAWPSRPSPAPGDPAQRRSHLQPLPRTRVNVGRGSKSEAIEVLAAAESLAAIRGRASRTGTRTSGSRPRARRPFHYHFHHRSHGHSHSHSAGASRGRLLVALCLSATVLVAEIVTALVTGSLALRPTPGFMLTDVAGLAGSRPASVHASGHGPLHLGHASRRGHRGRAPGRACSPSSGSSWPSKRFTTCRYCR